MDGGPCTYLNKRSVLPIRLFLCTVYFCPNEIQNERMSSFLVINFYCKDCTVLYNMYCICILRKNEHNVTVIVILLTQYLINDRQCCSGMWYIACKVYWYTNTN